MSDPTNDPFGLRSVTAAEMRERRGAKWQSQDAAYASWVADMDFRIAPVIAEALREVIDRNEFGYPNWGGPYALSPAAKLFPQRMADKYAWAIDTDGVHDLIDVLQGVRAAVFHRSAPGDGVVLHMPAYHPFLDTIEGMDRRLVGVHRVDGAFDYEALDAELTANGAAVWILCHPHNPLGHVFERAERVLVDHLHPRAEPAPFGRAGRRHGRARRRRSPPAGARFRSSATASSGAPSACANRPT